MSIGTRKILTFFFQSKDREEVMSLHLTCESIPAYNVSHHKILLYISNQIYANLKLYLVSIVNSGVREGGGALLDVCLSVRPRHPVLFSSIIVAVAEIGARSR